MADSDIVSSVELCECPPGYHGNSCEDWDEIQLRKNWHENQIEFWLDISYTKKCSELAI